MRIWGVWSAECLPVRNHIGGRRHGTDGLPTCMDQACGRLSTLSATNICIHGSDVLHNGSTAQKSMPNGSVCWNSHHMQPGALLRNELPGLHCGWSEPTRIREYRRFPANIPSVHARFCAAELRLLAWVTARLSRPVHWTLARVPCTAPRGVPVRYLFRYLLVASWAKCPILSS
jgi:hypothetical protein